jgi:hypothetical protein
MTRTFGDPARSTRRLDVTQEPPRIRFGFVTTNRSGRGTRLATIMCFAGLISSIGQDLPPPDPGEKRKDGIEFSDIQ